MTVGLVIPPSGFLLDERVFPALGILKVAAALEQAQVPVEVLDLSGATDLEAAVVAAVAHRRAAPEVYGITATMPQMPAAAAIARIIRRHQPDSRLVLGGPHVTLLRASARQEVQKGVEGRAIRAMRELHARFDVLVCGDGERAILKAIEARPGFLVDGDDPTSTLWLTKADLAAAPLPARHLIDVASYRATIEGVPAMSLIAQLGCPFGCTFCGGRRSPFLRRVRTRPTASVLEEIAHLHQTYGCRAFMFFDDELNVSPAFGDLLQGLCDLQARLGVTFRLRGLLKAELLTDAHAALMYQAGFRQLLVGFESGAERILTNIEKRATIADNTACLERLHRHGMTVKALMSIGHPGESPATLQETKAWLLAVQPDDFDVTIMTVYPGTPYFDDAVLTAPDRWTYTAKSGDRLHAREVDHLVDVNFYKGAPHNYQAFVSTDTLSAAALVEARDALEDDVRAALRIPYPAGAAAVQFEHSMGLR